MLTNDERDALRALARMKVANGSAFAPDVVLALLDALDAETARADYERGQADFWRNRAEDRETAQRASIGRLTRERDEARAAIAVARQEVERLREQHDRLYQATLIVGAERDAARALAERAVNGWEEADDLFREQGSDDPERLPAPGIADVRAALRGDGS